MENNNKYALILGCSGGFGRATALELAGLGYNIFGVHLDFGSNKKNAEELHEQIKKMGVKVMFFNLNAADEKNRDDVIEKIKNALADEPDSYINVLIHSLAFGSIGPLIAPVEADQLQKKNLEMTLHVMAHSLLYWSQDLIHNKLIREGSKIITLTSAGSSRAMKNYGAVSVAKAALESYVRQLAVELAPYKITVNALSPGVTNTQAVKHIPGYESMLEASKRINPNQRNTLPEDVSKAISLFINDKSYWITGQIIAVDGGESIVNSFE